MDQRGSRAVWTKRFPSHVEEKKRHLAEQTGIAPPSCVIGADCVGANESHVKLTSTLGSFWDKAHWRGGGRGGFVLLTFRGPCGESVGAAGLHLESLSGNEYCFQKSSFRVVQICLWGFWGKVLSTNTLGALVLILQDPQLILETLLPSWSNIFLLAGVSALMPGW